MIREAQNKGPIHERIMMGPFSLLSLDNQIGIVGAEVL